jgi:hypothetical protein
MGSRKCISKENVNWISQEVKFDILWSVNGMSRDIEAACHCECNLDVTERVSWM